jgi:Cd2+/Zn2+-exporting ATPase
MVERAQGEKAPIERILDRYAKLYTPIALVLAGVLWLATGEATRAITMLIVFCPCVMVLATPTALVASIGNAALRGSLVKKGATVEALERVDTVCFDKTGTLTSGRPRLVDAVTLDGVSRHDLLRLAAAAERHSEHPIGEALVRAGEAEGLRPAVAEDFEALPGLGVRARCEERSVLVGRPQLLADHGVAGADGVWDRAQELGNGGATVVAVAVGQRPAGLLAFEDELRPDAAAVIDRLHGLGVRTVLVSGDSEAAVERVASQLGIAERHAGVLPAGKAGLVQALQAQGRRVAFVGDGVNDGPALAVADVGVAMGRGGTALAVEAADVSQVADELERLPHLLGLSRSALRAIRQNLVFSLGVLALAVGLTIPGILTPVTGALLHELSSIPVIANSARLIAQRDAA